MRKSRLVRTGAVGTRIVTESGFTNTCPASEPEPGGWLARAMPDEGGAERADEHCCFMRAVPPGRLRG